MAKPIEELLAYMGTIADEQGAVFAQMQKLKQRKQAAPLVYKEVQQAHIQELQKRLLKQREINSKAQEQQAPVQAESPTGDMPMQQPTSTSVQPEVAALAARGAAEFGTSPPTVMSTQAGPVVPGGGGPGEPTSRQVITERGTRPNTLNTGSPVGNLLWRLGTAIAGKSEVPFESTREVVIFDELARRKSAADVFATIADRVPLSQAPTYKRAMDELATRGEFTPETKKLVENPKFKTFEETRADLAERGLDEDVRHHKMLEQIRVAEASSSIGASDANKRAAETKEALLQERYWRTVREREGEVNPAPAEFNMARVRGSTANPQLGSLQKDLSVANQEDAEDLSPAQINNFGVRVEATNQILTSEDDKLGTRPVAPWLALMAAAVNRDDVGVTREQQIEAMDLLESWQLGKKVANGKEVIDGKKVDRYEFRPLDPEDGNFSSYSGSLFEVYNTKLRGSDIWKQAVIAAGMEPKLSQQGHPGFGGGPAAAGRVGLTPEQHQQAVDQRTQLMQTLVPGIPESQVRALPLDNPLRRQLGQ